jgi:hypothetical protein
MTGKEYNSQFSEEELKNEVWKNVPNYEGFYQVSNLGRIVSLDRYVKKWNGIKLHKGRVLTPRIDSKSNRFSIQLNKEGKRINAAISRTVLLTFVGIAPGGTECCHNDGNCQNNRLENLRWDTPSNNQKDRIKHGTYQYGEKNPSAKLSKNDVLDIREMYATGKYTQREIARMYHINYVTVFDIVHRVNWKHI